MSEPKIIWMFYLAKGIYEQPEQYEFAIISTYWSSLVANISCDIGILKIKLTER